MKGGCWTLPPNSTSRKQVDKIVGLKSMLAFVKKGKVTWSKMESPEVELRAPDNYPQAWKSTSIHLAGFQNCFGPATLPYSLCCMI